MNPIKEQELSRTFPSGGKVALPISKRFLSTGEAARLLNLSRSTISRKYDLGILSGKKNPITGERLISRESILALMKLYDLPVEGLAKTKKVLVGTLDDNIFSLIKRILSRDRSIQIERAVSGSEIVNECMKKLPNLLILDTESTNIPATPIIQSLREKVDQKALKIICLSPFEHQNYFLEQRVDKVLTKSVLEKGNLEASFHLIMNYTDKASEIDLPVEHQRRWPRIALHLPVKIWLYRLNKPYLRDPGEAVVKNISCGGAFLSDIQFHKKSLPCEPFRFLLIVDQEPLSNWRAHCKVVRLQINETLAAGVQFIRISRPNLRKISAIFEGQSRDYGKNGLHLKSQGADINERRQ